MADEEFFAGEIAIMPCYFVKVVFLRSLSSYNSGEPYHHSVGMCISDTTSSSIVVYCFEILTKEARISRVLERQKSDIQGQLSKDEQRNNQILPEIVQFYTPDNVQNLLSKLEKKKQAAEKLLSRVDNPVPNPQRKKEIEEYVENCKNAGKELRELEKFYQQWN